MSSVNVIWKNKMLGIVFLIQFLIPLTLWNICHGSKESMFADSFYCYRRSNVLIRKKVWWRNGNNDISITYPFRNKEPHPYCPLRKKVWWRNGKMYFWYNSWFHWLYETFVMGQRKVCSLIHFIVIGAPTSSFVKKCDGVTEIMTSR